MKIDLNWKCFSLLNYTNQNTSESFSPNKAIYAYLQLSNTNTFLLFLSLAFIYMLIKSAVCSLSAPVILKAARASFVVLVASFLSC